MAVFRLIFIIVTLFFENEAARILAMIPTPSFSHQLVLHPIVQELGKRGHEVVFITTNPAYPEGSTPKNITEVDLQELSYRMWKQEFIISLFGKDNFITKGVKAIVEVTPKIFEEQMKTSEVQAVIRSGKFDLILLQAWFRPALIWSHLYRVPVIKISSFGMSFDNAENMGAPIHPILYPDTFHQRVYDLSFWEMLTELPKRYFVENIYNSNEEVENELLRRNFGADTPSLSELKKNVHMLFLNVHPLWERNRPLPRNVVYFGNVNQKPAKALTQEIKSFLDASPQGAIYISFGTNVPPSQLPKATIQAILRVFSELPYRVLWKWDQDELPDKPDHLMIAKWFPQADVFRHPNVKLVITQGGLQTTEEAINNGLPLIGVPMLGDQWVNVENYVYHGIGVQLDIENFREDEFKNAILEVMQNESYRQNVLRLRDIINDQPTTPLQRAVLWIEYTLKHGGLQLRPASANISRFEYMEVELAFIVATAICLIIFLLAYCVRRIVRYVDSMVNDVDNENK